MEFLVHPVNKGLAPIHYKYFVINSAVFAEIYIFLKWVLFPHWTDVVTHSQQWQKPCLLWNFNFNVVKIIFIFKNLVSFVNCGKSALVCWAVQLNEPPSLNSGPSVIYLLGTESLQSPFRTEFSMGSLSRRYWRSLRHHRPSPISAELSTIPAELSRWPVAANHWETR